jgi:methionine-rich copper-binding protein CopC
MRRSPSVARTWCLVAVLVAGGAGLASAGATLVASTPADGASVSAPPRLVLRFNGRIETKGSTITLVGGPRRTRVALLMPEASSAPDVLAFRLPPLQPGRYQVEWKGLSVDGHLVEGRLSFEVVDGPR